MKVDYHVHALAHGEYKYTLEWLTSFVHQAREMGLKEIGFSEHDDYLADVNIDLIEELRNLNPDISIRLGLEVDYKPEREDSLHLLTKAKPFDYLIGSVHFIDGWGFDHPDYRYKFAEYDIDDIYQKYFNLVDEAVKANLFDVIGHLDLIKVWGDRPRKNVTRYVEPVLVSIKEANLVIEINSAGLRKPVAEIYPQYEIIEMMKKMDIGITFASDAHHPSQIGLNIEKGIALAKRVGYKKMITFKERERTILSL